MAAAAFEELGVAPELIAAVEDLGWTLPTPVQAEAVPLILGGGDVMAVRSRSGASGASGRSGGSRPTNATTAAPPPPLLPPQAAETGSGKTGAFALPVLQIVHETLQAWARGAAMHGGGGAASAAPAAPRRRCELSSEDRDAALSVRDGTACQCRDERAWGGGRATLGAFAGRVYYEAEVCDEGLCRVGWATHAASYDIGTDRQSFGYGGTGKRSHGRQFEDYGGPFGAGDVVGACLDAESGALSFTKNGEPLGAAFTLPQILRGQARRTRTRTRAGAGALDGRRPSRVPPPAPTRAAPRRCVAQVLYPAVCLKNAELRLNFGDAPFKFGPPPGFVGIAQAPPDVTATAAAAAAAAASSSAARQPLCVVLEPSRDLAEQTHKCFEAYGRRLTAPPLAALRAGAEIVVATPGRLMDFVESGKLPLGRVRFLVLDEADRLVADAADVVAKLFARLPKGGAGAARLQVLMFSATLHSPEVKRLAATVCQQPLLVDLKGKDAVPETVDHVLVRVDPAADGSWLQTTPKVFTDGVHALDTVGPASRTPEAASEGVKRLKQRLLARLLDAHAAAGQALIFCRTNHDCDNLERFLNALGGGGGGRARGPRESGKEHPYSCLVLAGARSMDERRAALQAFKDGGVRLLIATDVAARGLDVSGLPCVINMTLPDRSEDYVHRVGRVGRADHMGLAISLVSTVPEKVWFCTVKGLKPWLQPDASNTKTQEQGGHTVWYDEPGLLASIEARLSAPIPPLNDDLSLPAGIAARLAGEGGAYGQARGGAAGCAEAAERLAGIRQNVEALAQLERQAQTSFLLLKRKLSGACVSAFYAVVLAMMMTSAEDSEATLQRDAVLEGVLVLLVAVIVVEFARTQLREHRREAAQHAAAARGCADGGRRPASSKPLLTAAADDTQDAVAYTARDQRQLQLACAAPERSAAPAAGACEPLGLDLGRGAAPCWALPGAAPPCAGADGAGSSAWREVPDVVFSDVMERLPAADQGTMRLVCSAWLGCARRMVTRLRPHHFPVAEVVAGFPGLKALDLSNCTKDITPAKLRLLRRLPELGEVVLGCHHRLIASAITDTCIAELVLLTRLHTLNLSQCVHVGDGGMMSLVYLRGLRSLNISGCVAVTDIGIMMVAQLTNLTSLDMPWCVKVTNIGLKALTPLTRLASLNISGCQLISEAGMAVLSTFTSLERLSLLNLGYSKVCVTDASLGRLSGLTKLRSLNIGSMQLANKLVTDESMALIAGRFTGLTQLGLMSLAITDTGVAHLTRLGALQALNLRGCAKVSSACLRHLSTLRGITDLCLLHNSRLEVDDACLSSLAQLPNLQILGLGNFQVNANASETCLVPLARSRQLLVLSVAFFTGRFGAETCEMLGGMTSLQHLDLQGSQHADAGLLAAAGRLTALQSLHLSRCVQVDDAALGHITGLTQLHTLNISICPKVTDAGLASVMRLRNLTHLLAQQCRDVTDAGVALLGRLTKLQVLDLSLCERVTGSGFAAFGGCRHMATLSLNGCASLNDGGLRAIGRMASLSKLDLSNCQLITDAGVSYLRGLIELTGARRARVRERCAPHRNAAVPPLTARPRPTAASPPPPPAGLDLALCVRVGDAALAAVASSMHQLATIKVNGCVRVTDAGVAEVCRIASLLTLHLDRCVHVTDAGLRCLTRLTGLTSLRISRCPNITDAGVSALSRLSRLSTLSLAQCPRVTDAGLLALAPLTTLASLEF
ncbi:DDX1 [Scenedesmus sp. PABB004]|nr:DDX1 [Scenedesmus sp. PABB004]